MAPEEPEHGLQDTDVVLLVAEQEGLVTTERLGSLQASPRLSTGQPRAEKARAHCIGWEELWTEPWESNLSSKTVSWGNAIPSTHCHKAVTR